MAERLIYPEQQFSVFTQHSINVVIVADEKISGSHEGEVTVFRRVAPVGLVVHRRQRHC
jgi:hypothetical protein